MYEDVDIERIFKKGVEYTCRYRYVENAIFPGFVCPECGKNLIVSRLVLAVEWARELRDGKRILLGPWPIGTRITKKMTSAVDEKHFPGMAKAVQDQHFQVLVCEGCYQNWKQDHDKLGRRKKKLVKIIYEKDYN
jgi:hypothetical protein